MAGRTVTVVLRPYVEIFRAPGAARFTTAAFLARLPMSTYGLGFVLLVSATTGRYGLAGAVTAAYGLAAAVVGPFVSRAVDRLGQARVLVPLASANAAGVALLVAAASWRWPGPALVACGALVGLTNTSVGSLVRARWRHSLAGTERLHTAFALESVLDELIFIVGPMGITFVATQLDPAAGLLAVALVAVAGASWLGAQRATEPPVHAADAVTGDVAVLRTPGVLVVVAVFLASGGIFGGAEVTAVAFTAERGSPGAAGVVLAAFALGSLLAGLAYGGLSWRADARVRFAVATVLLGLGTVPFALVTSVPLLGVVLFVAGLAISPMIVAGLGLVELVVAPGRLTEGLTWCTTALNLGAAAGAALCGPMIDTYGASRAFLVTVGCGAVAAALAMLSVRGVRKVEPAAAGCTDAL